VAVAVASAANNSVVLALIDSQGKCWRGDLVAGPILGWTDFAAGPAADPAVRPAAFLDEDGNLAVVAARKDPGPQDDVLVVAHQQDGEWPSPNADLDAADQIGKVKSIGSLTGPSTQAWHCPCRGERRQRIAQLAVTKPVNPLDYVFDVTPLPVGADGNAAYTLVAPRSGNALAPTLLLNAGGERLLEGTLWPGFWECRSICSTSFAATGRRRADPLHAARRDFPAAARRALDRPPVAGCSGSRRSDKHRGRRALRPAQGRGS
jgi:hypothetical protein